MTTLTDLLNATQHAIDELKKQGFNPEAIELTSDYLGFELVEIEIVVGEYLGHPRCIVKVST